MFKAGLLSLALLALAPAGAHAASVTVAPEGDLLEERGFNMVFSGVADDEDTNLYGRIKAAGATGCGPTYDTTDGDGIVFFQSVEGSFTVRRPVSPNEPGQYLVCAFLQQFSGDGTAKARGEVLITVRGNGVTVGVSAPPKVPAGQPAQIGFTGTSELERLLFATIKPAGPVGCLGSEALDEPADDFLFFERIAGAYATAKATGNLTQRGLHVVCAYVQESSSDAIAEAVGSATLFVTDCPAARGTASRARDELRKLRKSRSRNLRRVRRAKTQRGKRRFRAVVRRLDARIKTQKGVVGQAESQVRFDCTP